MASSAGKHRRMYTPEFRREAAHLVIDTGRTIAKVAEEIGVSAQLLGRWVAKERDVMPQETVVLESERAELERLRIENKQLKMDVAFLGKAAAFFASRSGPGTASL